MVGGASTGCCSPLDNCSADEDEALHDGEGTRRDQGTPEDDTNAEARPILANSNMQLPALAIFILRVGRGLLLEGVDIMVARMGLWVQVCKLNQNRRRKRRNALRHFLHVSAYFLLLVCYRRSYRSAIRQSSRVSSGASPPAAKTKNEYMRYILHVPNY